MQKKLISLIISTTLMGPFVLSDVSTVANAAAAHHVPPHHVVAHVAKHIEHTHAAHTHSTVGTKSSAKHAVSKTVTHTKTTVKSTTHKQTVATSAKKTVHATALIQPSKKAAANSINTFFSKFGKGKVEKLNGEQIIHAATEQGVTGQEAAIIAALATHVNNELSNNSKLTLKDVILTKQEILKEINNKTGIYGTYEFALKKINLDRSLPPAQAIFGPNGLSSKTRNIQSNLGDCFLISSLNGMLHSPGGPAILQNMIKEVPGKNNTYAVTFPDGQQFTVKLTEAETGMFSYTEGGGKWIAIMSVASAMARQEANLVAKTDKYKPVVVNNKITYHLDVQDMMNGGYPQFVLGLFTKKKYIAMALPSSSTTPTPQQLANIIDEIHGAKKNNLPISISTNDHVLSILGCEKCAVTKNAQGQVTAATGTVLIKNPWGSNNIYYSPTDGTWSSTLSNATKPAYLMTNNGDLKVPLSQINQGFAYVVFHPEKANEAYTPVVPETKPSST